MMMVWLGWNEIALQVEVEVEVAKYVEWLTRVLAEAVVVVRVGVVVRWNVQEWQEM